MQYHIRAVKKKDDEALVKVIQDVFEEFDAPRTGTVYADPELQYLSKVFPETVIDRCLYVAETIEGEILGCCGLFPTDGLEKGYVELVKFYLAAKARGKGVGKALMQKCLDDARKMQYTHVYIESIPEFEAAIHLYNKFDFKKLNTSLGNTGHGNCNVWMLKKL